uniref:Uncharacterized protein n=1 Tax=Rhizophora mucronata TaxID=61149 RepID=A0A2P2INK5_RHIMU
MDPIEPRNHLRKLNRSSSNENQETNNISLQATARQEAIKIIEQTITQC